MQIVHCVNLGESFQTHIFLQHLASIQPRTSPVKFAASTSRRPPRTARWTSSAAHPTAGQPKPSKFRFIVHTLCVPRRQKCVNLVYLVKSFPTSIYLHEHCLCLCYSRRIVFKILAESGQAYLSCARMPGFLFLNRTERTCLLACLLRYTLPSFLASENES